jgi:hypothetical protein
MEYHLQVVSAMRLPSDQWFHDLSGIPIPKETLKFLKKTSKQVESVMEVTLRFISSELKFASTLFKSGFTNFNRRDTSKNVKAKKNTSKEKTKPQKINVVSTEVEEKQDDKQEKENAEPIIELEISEEEILEVVFDDLNFEDTDEGELITEIYSEDISKILNQNQKGDEHISCIKSHIMGHKSDDVISFVAILRDFSDYVLDPSHEKEIPLIHRFAYILAIQDIIKEVENTDSIMNIHDSTIKEQIRLFKHSNRYEILQSKVQYSQRVF